MKNYMSLRLFYSFWLGFAWRNKRWFTY